MDESWKMRMGMPSPPQPRPKLQTYPARRSTEDATSHRRNPVSDDPEDFTDVFGGPPHTVLSRQFSNGNLPRSSSTTTFFYKEVFQPQENPATAVRRSGRSLPEFRIPGEPRRDHQRSRKSNRFYDDIFGFEDETIMRSRSRSKTSSSSVLSSEELSPLRPAIHGDDNDDVSVFASKLRPINVRWNSTGMENEEYLRKQKSGGWNQNFEPLYNTRTEKGCCSNYPFGTSRRNTSPETISLEPVSNGLSTAEDDVDVDVDVESPSSAVSSVCQSDPEGKAAQIEEEFLMQDDEDDDAMSYSYVIEINSADGNKEGTTASESNGVDEAIAWAKEKFQTYCSEKMKTAQEILDARQLSEGLTESQDDQPDKWAVEEEEEEIKLFVSKAQTEMQILDEKIRLWSTGKETDIRLLLTSLHHILRPESGWSAVPLANIIQVSQVKKAYQRARLCLHPDKLQQRGATLPEKYIAERAFSLLQDAWAAFLARDVFCR